MGLLMPKLLQLAAARAGVFVLEIVRPLEILYIPSLVPIHLDPEACWAVDCLKSIPLAAIAAGAFAPVAVSNLPARLRHLQQTYL